MYRTGRMYRRPSRRSGVRNEALVTPGRRDSRPMIWKGYASGNLTRYIRHHPGDPRHVGAPGIRPASQGAYYGEGPPASGEAKANDARYSTGGRRPAQRSALAVGEGETDMLHS